VFFIFYFKIYTVTMEGLDEELIQEIEAYSSVISEKGIKGVTIEIADEAESEDPHEEFYRLMTLSGEVLASTDTSSWGPVDIHDSLAKLSREDVDHVFQTLTPPEQEYKARMITAVIGPDVVLQIGETLEDAQEYLEIFRNLFLILLIIVMFLSALIGWFIARRALLDMEDVTETATEISKGVYDRRVQVKDRFEEIKRLGNTFNNMLDRIQNLLKSMREVNDNIAHDLRSPLTRIRGTAEMSLMSERSIDDYKNLAASTVEECDNLIDMINTMLDITEIESGVSQPKIENFDLVKVIFEAYELFLPVAQEKKIEMKVDLPEKLVFRGDRKNLQRIVSNLLDNALKYTPEEGRISISVPAGEEKIQIIFEDTGIGIAETDLPHIFDRFYRCDTSRSQEGAGLGLSLVKALTEAMNGTISVVSDISRGSRFAVTFPQ
ncbi:MAG: HAMP domain-containing protein, partial [Nitrospiraceae bacterium]